MVVVADNCTNGGGDSGEERDPQAAPQATPQLILQTSALVMPPFPNAEATSTVAAPLRKREGCGCG